MPKIAGLGMQVCLMPTRTWSADASDSPCAWSRPRPCRRHWWAGTSPPGAPWRAELVDGHPRGRARFIPFVHMVMGQWCCATPPARLSSSSRISS